MLIKNVTMPLNIDDMDDDIMSKSLYHFKYTNEPTMSFFNYIKDLGVIADVNLSKMNYDGKEIFVLNYINCDDLFHLKSINLFLLNCLNLLRGGDRVFTDGFKNKDRYRFVKNHTPLLQNIKIWLDSYIVCSIYLGIKNNLVDSGLPINNDRIVGKNIVSMILDDEFYNYYLKDDNIDVSQIYYFKKYFEEYTYDNKPLLSYMCNDGNFFLKIVKDMVDNQEFFEFLK